MTQFGRALHELNSALPHLRQAAAGHPGGDC
jgi:hypothetical protein